MNSENVTNNVEENKILAEALEKSSEFFSIKKNDLISQIDVLNKEINVLEKKLELGQKTEEDNNHYLLNRDYYDMDRLHEEALEINELKKVISDNNFAIAKLQERLNYADLNLLNQRLENQKNVTNAIIEDRRINKSINKEEFTKLFNESIEKEEELKNEISGIMVSIGSVDENKLEEASMEDSEFYIVSDELLELENKTDELQNIINEFNKKSEIDYLNKVAIEKDKNTLVEYTNQLSGLTKDLTSLKTKEAQVLATPSSLVKLFDPQEIINTVDSKKVENKQKALSDIIDTTGLSEDEIADLEKFNNKFNKEKKYINLKIFSGIAKAVGSIKIVRLGKVAITGMIKGVKDEIARIDAMDLEEANALLNENEQSNVQQERSFTYTTEEMSDIIDEGLGLEETAKTEEALAKEAELNKALDEVEKQNNELLNVLPVNNNVSEVTLESDNLEDSIIEETKKALEHQETLDSMDAFTKQKQAEVTEMLRKQAEEQKALEDRKEFESKKSEAELKKQEYKEAKSDLNQLRKEKILKVIKLAPEHVGQKLVSAKDNVKEYLESRRIVKEEIADAKFLEGSFQTNTEEIIEVKKEQIKKILKLPVDKGSQFKEYAKPKVAGALRNWASKLENNEVQTKTEDEIKTEAELEEELEKGIQR